MIPTPQVSPYHEIEDLPADECTIVTDSRRSNSNRQIGTTRNFFADTVSEQMVNNTAGTQHTIAGIDLGDTELAATVCTALADVEKLLGRVTEDLDTLLQHPAPHRTETGGVRFRPLFTLLAGQFGPWSADPAVLSAAAVAELVHLATLYHGDVRDQAPEHRAASSTTLHRGNDIAILTGDYLSAHASRLAATLGPKATRIVAETFAAVVTGQVREKRSAQSPNTVEHYLQVVAEKTGSSIGACCRLGGMFSGASHDHVELLARFGAAAGTAVQISEDIVSTSSVSGRYGTDLRKLMHTLPMVYALREEGATGAELRELLIRPVESGAEVEEALELLSRSRGMASAKEVLRAYADVADAELSALPCGFATDALRRFVRYFVERVE